MYTNCDNTNLTSYKISINETLQDKLREFRESYFPILEVQLGNMANGVAASYYGQSTIGATLHRCKYENGGDFPDYLLKLTLKAYYKTFKNKRFDLILYVPPTHSGDLVRNFAEKISSVIKVPISHSLCKTRETTEQKIFQNAYSKRDNIVNAFNIDSKIVANKKVILVDDIFDSGATIKEIGKLLTSKGAIIIAPLVIAKTIGGELS